MDHSIKEIAECEGPYPIPIATMLNQDGRTEPVYKLLVGHENLFDAQRATHKTVCQFRAALPKSSGERRSL